MIDTVIILAAGRGTRLKELTRKRSKAMLPVAGKPMVQRVIESCTAVGIKNVILVVSPHDQEIRDFYSQQSNATFIVQEQAHGAGDAIHLCARAAPENFIVSACDSLVDPEHVAALISQHENSNATITLSVLRVPESESLSSRSVVRVANQRVLEIIEKPSPNQRVSNIMSLPLYCMSRKIFGELAKVTASARGEIETQDAIQSLINQGELVTAVEASQRRQVSDAADLLALNLHYLNKLSPPIQVDKSITLPKSVKLTAPVLIEAGCIVAEEVTLGPGVFLETGSTIARGFKLRNVVVTRDAQVTCDLQDQVY